LAQHAFRVRRQAAHAALERQIERQESTMKQMASIFLRFSDDMMQSEFAKLDADLMQKLQQSMKHIVTLVKDMDDGDNDSDSDRPSKEVRPSMSAHPARDVVLLPAVDGDSMCQQKAPESSQGRADEPNAPMNHAVQGNSASTTKVTLVNSNPPAIANVFGNGWPGHPPPVYTTLRDMGIDHQISFHALSLKVIHFALQRAYFTLLESVDISTGLVHSMFQFSLARHSRQDILFTIRWFLGPGHAEMYRLAIAPFGPPPAMEIPPIPILNPIVDTEALENLDGRHSRVSFAEQPFLNSNSVVTYLLSKGIRIVDDDTLEWPASIGNTFAPVQAPPQHSSDPSKYSTFLSADTFFPSGHVQDLGTSSRLSSVQMGRISQSLLFRSLSDISVCLAFGPGFRTECLDRAISASIIDDNEMPQLRG
jgi:hypothetical protein